MKIFDNRNEMLTTLPEGLIIAEIGIFKGEFAKIILDTCKPSQLILIDPWEERVCSGDCDGNNMCCENGEILYNGVCKLFENNPTVQIKRNYSTSILDYPDNYFDMIYIDADHSYEGVKLDLKNSYQKIKNGGYIMGHDYDQNMNKSRTVYHFGVKQAVDEFCIIYKQEMIYKAMDGCTSFGMKISK